MTHSARGSKRVGAGRSKGSKTAVDKLKPKAKVVRIPISLWEKIELGYFGDLEALLANWQFRSEDASTTSLRWQKLRELFEEIKQISLRNSNCGCIKCIS